MDFADKLAELKEKILKLKDQVETEEATKTAFVMPLISTLGYDVFDPSEVVPEYTADIGIKKGEKIDYCILKEAEPIIIIECKHWKENLDGHTTQLHRYFHATKTRFGILTNGIVYRFYTDLDEKNKMDSKPFFEVSLENLNESLINELKRFQKTQFDLDSIVSSASDLKYSKQIREILSQDLKEPSEEFVKYFASKVYEGRITQKVSEQFKGIVRKSCKHLISEIISERLQAALNTEKVMATSEEIPEMKEEEVSVGKKGIVTTPEEEEAFRIVKAILVKEIGLSRVFPRDTKSYFGVLLDNNNRKPICRFHFNGTNKYLGLIDESKNEERFPLETLDQIYNYADKICKTVSFYEEA
ncbi:type I restriction endonuclease [Pontibacter sp. G13]|uniref:type I restriction endonuclease n=1 Tax=Pontibacter sp. G13 TaxID=3074898 RepID=UPI00288B97AA|nr:type I restriction endonuclease [Pontibacter sp. G13]WNJ20055.1 type I restriction enzyme HsdR N-terminal domain-containing protein [Pontibacter sp. G13]